MTKPAPGELIAAIENDDIGRVKALLEQGVDPDHTDEYYVEHKRYEDYKETALKYAVRKDKPKIVKLLLEHGADPDLRGKDNFTALMYAARNNKPALADMLLDHGADPDIKDSQYRFTALMHAAWWAELFGADTVRLLIDRGADLDVKSGNLTVVELAQRSEVCDEARKLIRNGKARQMQLAGEKPVPGEFIKTVSEYDPDSDPEARYSPSLDIIKIFLACGADPNEKDPKYGETPLHLALRSGPSSNELIKMLIESGASLETTNKAGDTPLMYAAAFDNIPALNILLEKGVSLHKKNLSGSDALERAKNGYVYWGGHGHIPRASVANAPASEAVAILTNALDRERQAKEQTAREAREKEVKAFHDTAAGRQDALKNRRPQPKPGTP